jgi:hypothetical protein
MDCKAAEEFIEKRRAQERRLMELRAQEIEDDIPLERRGTHEQDSGSRERL